MTLSSLFVPNPSEGVDGDRCCLRSMPLDCPLSVSKRRITRWRHAGRSGPVSRCKEVRAKSMTERRVCAHVLLLHRARRAARFIDQHANAVLASAIVQRRERAGVRVRTSSPRVNARRVRLRTPDCSGRAPPQRLGRRCMSAAPSSRNNHVSRGAQSGSVVAFACSVRRARPSRGLL